MKLQCEAHCCDDRLLIKVYVTRPPKPSGGEYSHVHACTAVNVFLDGKWHVALPHKDYEKLLEIKNDLRISRSELAKATL